MATTSSSSSSSSTDFFRDNEKLDLRSVMEIVCLINQHIHEFLVDAKARRSLKLKCTSKLKIGKQEFFEFSEHSILSNLYWGIESTEAAIQAKWTKEKTSRMSNSEKMLQVPALLDEHGVTAGIPNHNLVSCSYFYLSIVRKLQKDDWQVAMHFLHALLVSPQLVHKEFAPELCQTLFVSCITRENKNPGARRSSKSGSLLEFNENEVSEAIRGIARRYKAWLIYHQVMSYGEKPGWQPGCTDIPTLDDGLQHLRNMKSGGTESSNSYEHGDSLQTYHKFEKVHPLNSQEGLTDDVTEESIAMMENYQGHMKALTNLEQNCSVDMTKYSNIKCVKDILKESQSDTPISLYSFNSSSAEETLFEESEDSENSLRTIRAYADDRRSEFFDKKQQAPCSTSNPAFAVSMPQAPEHMINKEANEVNRTKFFSGRFPRSCNDSRLPVMDIRDIESHALRDCHIEEEATQGRLEIHDLQRIDHRVCTSFSQIDHEEGSARRKESSSCRKNLHEVCLDAEEDTHIEQVGVLEKIISNICFSGRGKCEEDYTVEITTIYEMLNNKAGLKYSLLKDVILDQLLMAISSSKEDGVIRASVSILSTIMLGNTSVIEEIKNKGLQLSDLASALKRNIHEAAILIYLTNPSAAEIKNLELFPTLLDVVCTSNSYKGKPTSLLLTPPAASLMIIEVLVTAFDCETNKKHLAAISSPSIIAELLDVPRKDNVEEFISLAAILVRCMRFDGQCREHISQFTPLAPFIFLLTSNQKRATFIALEFFHEILRMPRSSAISLLQHMQKEGSINNICALWILIQKSEPEYKLLAANLLLQLDMVEDSSGKTMYREEAINALLESVTCEENYHMQQLSAFILSNLGGTYAWTGEPYTIAWLVKKAGLTSLRDRNVIRNVDWSDQSVKDPGTDKWCSKIARCIIKFGNPVFHALEKGLKSKAKRVSRDCLTAIAWLGCEIVKSPDDIRYSACEILLSTIEQYIHPGLELEERLLACLCIYNYASGRGMQKVIHFSEGVRESLRRLSNISWMAEELLKVTNYLQPNKWRISCVHTQILEVGPSCSGAVTALIYYKGQLYSGYTDGSIKVWDIKGQKASIVWDTKEHKKAVTCFSLFEPGNCLLSGSADKTIRIWRVAEGKLDQAEVITMKEPIQSLDTCGELIFAITRNHKMKVFDATRKAKDLFKNKHVKCITVAEGKVYVGCTDSSIQDLVIINGRQQEMKAPSKRWMMQNRPINSVAVYKDWLYSASAVVEGSKIKDWKLNKQPQLSIVQEKGSNVLAMEVVEDFIYLNCSSSTSSLQIWLRGMQHNVGRLSAGSKITSLLTANDMILCGTETGLIKGWIPL